MTQKDIEKSRMKAKQDLESGKTFFRRLASQDKINEAWIKHSAELGYELRHEVKCKKEGETNG